MHIEVPSTNRAKDGDSAGQQQLPDKAKAHAKVVKCLTK